MYPDVVLNRVTKAAFLRDFTGDGWPDIIVVNDSNTSPSEMYLNVQIDGVFSHFADLAQTRFPGAGGAANHAESADFDGVNGPDLLFANTPNNSQDRLWLNDGTGFFLDVTGTQLPAAFETTMDVAVGDLNGVEDYLLEILDGNDVVQATIDRGGVFYNHALGSDRAPNPALIAMFPSLAFDSFVTIGKKDSAGDLLTITPGFPEVSGSQLTTDSSGWAITPNDPQGNPFDAANSFPGDGRVLIGQFSTADGTAISGTMLFRYIDNLVSTQLFVTFFHVPTPGALAMMGLMGAAGVFGRRRRRGYRRDC